MFQVRLAAKSKMDSNISDLLPVTSQGLAHGDDPLAGRLRFSDQAPVVRGDMDTAGHRWRSVVKSPRKKFETSNLKKNKAYVIIHYVDFMQLNMKLLLKALRFFF